MYMLPVSAVIPAYRCAGMVERAVRSAQSQRPAPAEVIVVDDASGDDTGPNAERLGARLIVHERNQGEGAARNTGLRAASQPWVAFLDCDDEWLPGHLEVLWEARGEHVLAGSAALGFGERAEDHRVYGWAGRRPRVLHGPADVAIPENKVTASSVLVNREAALEAGGFRTDLPRATDLDLWLRMLERGTGVVVPQVTALYRQHTAQVSADRLPMLAAQQAILDGYSDRGWCTRSVRRRHEGRIAWDDARAAIATGRRRAPALLRLTGRLLLAPSRAAGVAQLIAGRHAIRRMTCRYVPGGDASVALLPGADADGYEPHRVVDLRARGLPRALGHLARRPTSQALVPGRAAALAVRALGVEPVSSPRDRAGTAG
jgi:glycosyltransferase involved in cell wall biosynthesis